MTGPEALSFDEAAQQLSTGSGRRIRHRDVTSRRMKEIITDFGMPDEHADVLLGLFEMIREGQAADVADTVERLTARPARSVGEYARDHATELGS